ncbi:MAG: pseudouridine-5'-phosphate glycosidase [Gemmatimonadaceae bacterium]|jgi:pseudouridine-5'-phosphate glycosidase|nr:pseudouridine-5'-phosphate glycosidase [Gemmatimonadaceae bacterium]
MPHLALESSVFAQGLPIPENREALTRMTSAAHAAGATPRITAVVRGSPTTDLAADPAALERFLARDGVRKVSTRDLALCMAQHGDGATTVAATMHLAASDGIDVFATGGIGGVHRDAPFDESGDLVELARTPVIVVCAGAKSILDLPATLERLETLGVTVLGYRTNTLPGFFTAHTGVSLADRVDSVEEIAAVWRAHRALGRTAGLLVMQPPPAADALDAALVDAAVEDALAEARTARVRGGAVTPFLLAAVARRTNNQSLRTNLSLLEANAALGGAIAARLARP